MIRKICSKCKVEKEICEFHKLSRSNDGYRGQCKECRKVDTKLYYQNNSKKLKEKSSKYRLNNPEKIKEGLKKYRLRNLSEVRRKNREWSKSENGKKSKKQYYEKNSEKVKKNVAEYRKKNPTIDEKRRKSETRKKYMLEYRKKHREEKPHIYLWRAVLRNTIKRLGTGKEGKTKDRKSTRLNSSH